MSPTVIFVVIPLLLMLLSFIVGYILGIEVERRKWQNTMRFPPSRGRNYGCPPTRRNQ